MVERRVVVTGLGTISPNGNNVGTMWDNVVAGNTGIAHISRIDTEELPATAAAEVKDLTRLIIWKKKKTPEKWTCSHNMP